MSELAAASLRIQSLPDVLMELADGDRMVVVLIPPDREQVGDGLPALRRAVSPR